MCVLLWRLVKTNTFIDPLLFQTNRFIRNLLRVRACLDSGDTPFWFCLVILNCLAAAVDIFDNYKRNDMFVLYQTFISRYFLLHEPPLCINNPQSLFPELPPLALRNVFILHLFIYMCTHLTYILSVNYFFQYLHPIFFFFSSFWANNHNRPI